MRRFKPFIILSLISLSLPSFAQNDWKDMMDDPTVNIYTVVEQAERYFHDVDKDTKGSGWKTYQRWLYENEPKYFPSGDRSHTDPYFVSNAYEEFKKNNRVSTRDLFNNGWEELGPYYIGQVTGHYSVGLGRVETFYVDPNNAQRLYLGSRSGGFWRSLDGGANWTGNTTDTLLACGVNTMTVSPTNPDSILINVRNARNGTTHGIYRSTDGGDNWTVTNFNPTNLGWGGMGTNRQVYQVAYHPTVPGLVFIGTNEGLFRSADDMATWTIPVPALDFTAIAFHPLNPNTIYASNNNDRTVIYVSTNGGVTFTTSNPVAGNTASIKLSTTPDCPNCLYVRSSDGIWKSTDNGMNYSFLSDPGINNFGGFAVSDVNSDIILIGDIDTHISYDEGQTFNKVTFWSQGNANYNSTGTYVHADIRSAQCLNGVFWTSTDGFLCKSDDNGLSWEFFEGQSIRENYNLGVSQSNHWRTICGSQDNGTSIKTENSWVELYGADGMEGIIHPLNDDWMIGSYQYGGRRRTLDGGQTQHSVTPPGQTGSWIAPLFYDPNDPMVVYHAGEYLYRSNDFGTNWIQIGTPSFTGTITYAAIAEDNSDIIVVCRQQNIELSTDGGTTFTSIRGTLPYISISDVAFDPNDDSTLVVTYANYQNDGQKVFITTDLGATWQNITYNLNDMPIRAVVIDHTDAATIYLGGEIGVYKKAMAETSWTLYNPNLPNMAVIEMEVMYGSNTLRAATWGRGLWEYTLDGRTGYPAILSTEITDPPTAIKPMADAEQTVTSVISYDNSITSVWVGWSLNSPTFDSIIPMTNTLDSTWVTDTPIPGQAFGTKVYFKVYAVGSNGDTTETYKFMYETREFDYCTSNGNMSYATAVTLVDLAGIYNETGKTQPYTDYSDTLAATMELQSSHDLTVNLNTDGNYTIYAKAWIDWNLDAEFDETTEEYDLGTAVNTPNGPTSLSPLNITVPVDANIGETTMRVSAKYNAYPTPCETGFDGEVEDYAIVITKIYLVESIDTSICFNDSIFAGGAWQNTTGTYYDTVYISSTTDSVYITNLEVIPLSIYTQILEACDSLTWIDGITYYASTSSPSITFTSSQGCDSVINLNLTIHYNDSAEIQVTTCDSYTVPSGDETWYESGVYMDTIPTVAGCDSILIITLELIEVDTTVTVDPPTLTSNAEGAEYQWIDCQTMEPIEGATSQSYTATENSLYAVIVTQEGCTDTSACYLITGVYTPEHEFGEGFRVYPNPTTDMVILELGHTRTAVTVKIHDLAGHTVDAYEAKNTSRIDLRLDGPAGTYIIEVLASDGKKAIVKVVKE